MKRSMLILIILAGFFPAILAIAQYCENDKKEKEANKKEIELKSKIDSLNIANSALSKQIGDLSNDNIRLSHQLTEASLILNENVTGNGKLDLWAYQTQPGKIKFRVKNDSDFPSYDVKIVIEDYDEIIKCKHSIEGETVYIETKCLKNNTFHLDSFNISSGTQTELPNVFDIKTDYIHYVFQINTRKKLTIRQSIFKINGAKMDQSYRIYERQKGKLILIEENNPLKVSKEYWEEHFYSQPYIFFRGFE